MFNEAELKLLRVACLAASLESGENGYDEQSDEFFRLAGICTQWIAMIQKQNGAKITDNMDAIVRKLGGN
jgi:hypothetical protein